MRAAILTIGTEVLIGDVVNSNAAFISEKLTALGYSTEEILTIADNKQIIMDAIIRLFNEHDVVVCTGGLGPTSDDITASVLASFFHSKMILSETVLTNIQNIFSKRGWEVSETNRLQAMVPDNALILNNELGTAPGLLFRRGGKVLVALPGVPFEMKNLMEQVVKYITENFSVSPAPRKFYMFTGIGESNLSDLLKDFETEIKHDRANIAYLPSPGIIRMRITLQKRKDIDSQVLFNKYSESLRALVPDHLYSENGETLPQVIALMMKNSGKTISLAESCTGGYISHLLTSIPGASEWYKGGITAYSNEVKIKMLNVDENDINSKGAVSKEVASQMATGVLKALGTDFSIGITGIAGPDGGTAQKPVGTVWIAAADKNHVVSKSFLFGDNRQRNIIRASFAALDMIRKL